jgi:hypothetical protein
MFHFDQPAVLGLAALFWSWVRYYKLNDKTTVLWVSLLAPLMGRGYVSNFALLTWVLIELYGYLKRREGSIWRFVAHRSVLCCLLGGIASTSALAYNLAMESKVRQVPLAETSIVISAKGRLGFDESREQGDFEKATWGNLARKLVNRVFVGLSPFVLRDVGLPSVHDIGVSLLWLAFFILLYRKRSLWKNVWKRSKEENGKLLLLMALSGLLWVIVLKRLIIFHDYTAEFLLGFYMVFWFLATQWLWQLWSKKTLIGVALAVFVLSVGAKRYFDDQYLDLVTQDTQDMEQILAKTPAGSRVFVEGGYSNLIKNAPYAPCYYFSEQIIVDHPSRADFRITRQIRDGNFGLTPNNKGIFLHNASDEK